VCTNCSDKEETVHDGQSASVHYHRSGAVGSCRYYGGHSHSDAGSPTSMAQLAEALPRRSRDQVADGACCRSSPIFDDVTVAVGPTVATAARRAMGTRPENVRICSANCPHVEMKLKQNSFETVSKLFRNCFETGYFAVSFQCADSFIGISG